MRDGIEFLITDENGKSPWIFLKNLLQYVESCGMIYDKDNKEGDV